MCLSVYSLQIIRIVVGLMEAIINGVMQFLLRRIVNIKLLQALMDLANDPAKALGLARRANKPPDEPGVIVRIPFARDKTTVSAADVHRLYGEASAGPAGQAHGTPQLSRTSSKPPSPPQTDE